MFSAVYGMSTDGIQAYLIKVEVDVSNGLPSFDIVGLPAVAVKEARERVRSAIRNSGFEFPLQRVTVNLAPADLRKNGSGLDLAIAIGILAATNQIESHRLKNYVFIGELSLEGAMCHVPGVLAMAVSLRNLHLDQFSQSFSKLSLSMEDETLSLIVAKENLSEARLIEDLPSYAASNLNQLVRILNGLEKFDEVETLKNLDLNEDRGLPDWKDIKGQTHVKRALEIAASGGHNLLMLGPPGSGKTLLAKAFAGILPPLTQSESLDVTQLYSVSGLLSRNEGLIKKRPFRNPHHTATKVGLIGGGREMRPGEISLANHGVLFLDELPEFSRDVLETLRQPLEDRYVVVTRQKGSIKYPARISLIAAMNPCPCGFYGDEGRSCICTPNQIQSYRNRISGPLLDRFDLHVQVPRVTYMELNNRETGESSEDVSARVIKSRRIQWDRLGIGRTNSEMSASEVQIHCILDDKGEALLRRVYDNKYLSARGHNRLLRVARTIADMNQCEKIQPEHLAEGLQLRLF